MSIIGQLRSGSGRRHALPGMNTARILTLVLFASLLVAACSGPETGDDADAPPTATATVPVTPTVPAPTATATYTPTVAASPTLPPSPTASPTPTVTPTASATGSATVVADIGDQLPSLPDLPGGGTGYSIAEEGTRSAQDLANAYADPAAHLQRLNEWGFKRHVFRSFSLAASVNDPKLPETILTTVNVYGSPKQADEVVTWLKALATAQGASEATPPDVGDDAVAVTQPTASGEPTASIYVRDGDTVFVYFAQGGDPLPAVTTIAQHVFAR